MNQKIKAVITDLDGTLLNNEHQISLSDRQSLIALGSQNIIRIAATGRSVFSAKKVLSDDFPIDYLVFSSGVGVLDWKTKQLLLKHELTIEDVNKIQTVLESLNLDYFIQLPVPNNHESFYSFRSGNNPDFQKRINLYQSFTSEKHTDHPLAASQLLAIDPFGKKRFETTSSLLTQFSVIRATSPLDHKSTWIEIFPKNVSKALSSEHILSTFGITPVEVAAIGNDYNDLSMLTWAGHPFVVSNAPDDLKTKFKVVNSHLKSGFSDMINNLQTNRFI